MSASASYNCCGRSAGVKYTKTTESQGTAMMLSLGIACVVFTVYAAEAYLHCSCWNAVGAAAITDDSPTACFGLALRRVLTFHQSIVSSVIGDLYPVKWAALAPRTWCGIAGFAATVMSCFVGGTLLAFCRAGRKERRQ